MDLQRATFFNLHSGRGGARHSIGGGEIGVYRGDKVVVTVTTGAEIGPEGSLHRHAQEQWTLVSRGTCRMHLAGEIRSLAELDVVQIPTATEHRFEPTSPDTMLVNIFEAEGLGTAIPGEATTVVASDKVGAGDAVVAARRFNMRDPRGGLARKLAEGMNSTIFASPRLMVSVVRIDPDCKGALHKHPHEQWGVLIAGSGRRIAEHDFTPVEAGDFWFTPGEELHTFQAGPAGAFILEVFSPPREDYLIP